MSTPVEVTSPAGGLHVRAGNSMVRTRAGLLDGAVSCIEREGLRRLTMSAVATRSGVAKATLYNHFRTKDDVLRALVAREVVLVADAADAAAGAAPAGTAPAAVGLARAAREVAEHVALRRVAAEDPGALLPLLVADPAGEAFDPAGSADPADDSADDSADDPDDPDDPVQRAPDRSLRAYAAARVGRLLGVDPGRPVVEVALRWIASQALAPQNAPERDAAAQVIAASAQPPAG